MATPHPAELLRLDLALPLSSVTPKTMGRASRLNLSWHDTHDGALATIGLALVEIGPPRRRIWQLQRVRPATPSMFWQPGGPDGMLAEAASPHELPLPEGLSGLGPRIGLRGRQIGLQLAQPDVVAVLTEGVLHAGVARLKLRRVTLAGPLAQVQAAALALGASVPGATLSGCAQSLAWPELPPRRAGAPQIDPDSTVGGAFSHIVAHLVDIIVGLVPDCRADAGPEPIHATRVAIRRLRSALALFGESVPSAALQPLKPELRRFANALGPARAWDVFLSETGADIRTAMPRDAGVERLLEAAGKCRVAAYTSLRRVIVAPDFAALAVRLACLAAMPPDPEVSETLASFAARTLKRRMRKLRDGGRRLATLEVTALHDLRLQAKRLRYAAEFFAPLYPAHAVRRMLRDLAELQAALGRLNDDEAAASLLAQLPPNLAIGHAGGVVRGFVAGRNETARSAIAAAWRRLRKHALPW